MIHLLPRKPALYDRALATCVATWQQRFDPDLDPYVTVPGGCYGPASDKFRWYGQEEMDHRNHGDGKCIGS